MQTHCTHCGIEYQVEDATLPAAGLQMQCGACNQVFFVHPGPAVQYMVRTATGEVYDPGDLATLQRWIVERRVSRDDLLARDNQVWQRLGNIVELVPFFSAMQPNLAPEPQSFRRAPPAAPKHRPVMPRLTPKALDEESMVSPLTGSLSPVERRTTGRKRTGRPTLDQMFDEPRSGFSFPTEPHDEETALSRRRRSRSSRSIFAVLVSCCIALAAVYVYRPQLLAAVVSSIHRPPVADLAVQETQRGRDFLQRDSMAALGQAVAAFDKAGIVDGHFSDAQAGLSAAYLARSESYSQAADDLASYAANVANKKDRMQRQAQIDEQRQAASQAAERAFAAAKQAVMLAPESLAANLAMADYYRVQNSDADKIKPLLDRARAMGALDPRTLALLAGTMARQDPNGAAALYQDAIARFPSFNRARYRLARLYLRQKDPGRALTQVQAILKDAPDHELAQGLLSQLQPLVSALPSAASAPLMHGAEAPTQDSPAAGAPAVATHDPAAAEHAVALEKAAAEQALQSEKTAADQALAAEKVAPVQAAAEPAAAQKPASPDKPVAAPSGPAAPALPALAADASLVAILTQAQLLRVAHQGLAAADLYQRALRKDANNAAAYQGLGWCALDAQDFPGAQQAFTTALQKTPWSADAHFGLAEALRNAGAPRDAMKHYRQVLMIQPGSPLAGLARQMLEQLSK